VAVPQGGYRSFCENYARNHCAAGVSDSVQLNVQLACICVQLAWRPPPITPARCTRLRAPLWGANRCGARNDLRAVRAFLSERPHALPACSAKLALKAAIHNEEIRPKMPFGAGCCGNPSGKWGRPQQDDAVQALLDGVLPVYVFSCALEHK
jgi:hypothetical protein